MKNLFILKHSKSVKTLLLLTLCSPFLMLQASPNWDADQSAKNRLEVRSLLEQAHVFWNDPGKISDAGYTGKLPSKLEAISTNLTKASELAPERLDIKIALANNLILQKQTEKALSLFSASAIEFNNNPEALTYQAIWSKYLKKDDQYKKTLSTLKKVSPNQYAAVQRSIEAVDMGLKSPLVGDAFKIKGHKTAIITLGYALEDDGTMNVILIKRLEKTLEAVKLNPESIVVVTGGVPKKGITEAIIMKKWLVKHGVKADKIIIETYARSTVENALYSTDILAKSKISSAVIISSASHVRRAITLFDLAAKQTGQQISFTTLAYFDTPLSVLKTPSNKEAMGLYRDSLRVTHHKLYSAYPFVDQ